MRVRIDLTNGTWHEGRIASDGCDVTAIVRDLSDANMYAFALDAGRTVLVPVHAIASIVFTEDQQ